MNLRRELFYLLDYITRRSEKFRFVKEKMVQRQIGDKFSDIGILFAPLNKTLLLISQILNINNYKVLFG